MRTPFKRLFSISFGLMLFSWAVLLNGCADREHANPLDPLNPQTHGQPPRLKVVSDHHKVQLSWPATNLHSISNYQVYRWTDSSEVKKIATVPVTQHSFVDSLTVYGTRYFYAYSLLAGRVESVRSPAASIIPGPAFFWVSYRSSGQILRLTFDIQHPYQWMSGVAFPSVSVVVGPGKGIWIADAYLGELLRYSASGQFLFKIQGLGRIPSFQLDRRRGRLWVADSKNKQVVNLDTTGVGYFAVRGLQFPRQVLVNESTGGCWILDAGRKEILYADPNGHVAVWASHLLAPQWMSFDSQKTGLWIADSARVVHYRSGKKIQEIPSFTFAYFVAVDALRDKLWVFDQSHLWFGTDVIQLQPGGEIIFRKRGFEAPSNLVVDPFDGSCVIADTYNVRIVKLSCTGQELAVWETDSAPWWVSIEE